MKYEDYSCIEQCLAKYARSHPERTAIIVKDTRTSYGELWRLVCGFARYLAEECGVQKGDRVAIKTMQTLDFVVAYLSTHLCGAVAVPLEKSISDAKAYNIIAFAGANTYITDAKPETFVGAQINLADVCELSKSYRSDEYNWVYPAADDTSDIMFTAGTTGKPKGVELTHGFVWASARDLLIGLEVSETNVILVPGPLNHGNALRKLYMTILNGSTMVILNGLTSMEAFFNAIEDYDVNSLCLPPASLRTIWLMSGDKLSEYAGQIEFVESASSPLNDADKARLRQQLPRSRLYNNYGCTECAYLAMYDYNKYPDKPIGCVGTPNSNSDVVIVDEDFHIIKSSYDHRGLIATKSLANMKGYWQKPEMTAAVMRGGYIRTNDIGYYGEDGFLYLVGRLDDTINVGGLKVEPTEVEEAVCSFDGIHECMCVPVDDPLTGSALKIYVVMGKGCVLNVPELRKYLAGKLLPYQMPKYYAEISEIPRNSVGKPDRKRFVNGKLIESK